MQNVTKNDIKKWLEDEGLFKNEAADDSAEFHYVVEYNNNAFDIIQPKGKDDLVLIVCGTQVSPEHIKMMEEASESRREEFLYHVRFKINELEADFQMDVSPDYILNQFIIQDGYYEDALTKNNLIRAIKHVFRTKMSVVWLMEKEFGPAPISGDANPTGNENMMFM